MKIKLFTFAVLSLLSCMHATERITLQKNETFPIELPSNPSTGYSWYLKSPEKKKGVHIKELDYKAHQPVHPGSSGIQKWQVTGKKPGSFTTLTFEYKRPWEKNTAPKEIMIYKIYVENNE